MNRRGFLVVSGGGLASGILSACGGGSSTTDPGPMAPKTKAVVGWNETALQAIRTTKPGPPMAARSLAVLHTAMYDAWAAYDETAVPSVPQSDWRQPIVERTDANRLKAISHAAYAALLDQFPTQKAAFETYMASLGMNTSSSLSSLNSAEGIGRAAAQAVIERCHADGSNQLGNLASSGLAYADYTDYQAMNPPLIVAQPSPLSAFPAPGNWQPLSYIDASGTVRTPGYLAACWDRVKPFALASASQYRPGAPAAFGSSAYLSQAQQIVDMQASLTEKQKVIAEYWADGPSSETPPGHWCLVAQYVSKRDMHDDNDDIQMFFLLSNALFDAGIAAWDAKKAYNSARPITAIRFLMNGKTLLGYGTGGPAAGLQSIAGESWTPFQPSSFPTPPFPEHVSGHSTFSAAAADVLSRFTGSDFLGWSYTQPVRSMTLDPALPTSDVTLHWSTFTDATNEAGISRLYGGIHFENANRAGLKLGRDVGAAVFARAERLWRGVA